MVIRSQIGRFVITDEMVKVMTSQQLLQFPLAGSGQKITGR
jgi:hypothetical protein